MSAITIRVRGAADFAANQQAFLQHAQNMANFGLDTMASIAQGAAMDDCPVGTPESTGKPGYVGGTLRDGHQIEKEQDGYRFIRYVYNDVDYARYVHDGTYKVAARPWFLNAVLATQGDFLPAMTW